MNYLDRIQIAIDFIESNLRDELSSESVAASAGFSEYHFHRIFTAVVGESVSQYIRARRMSLAAGELSLSNKGILEIAVDSGFDSQESFTRAFKKAFGITPGQCRRGAPAAPLRSRYFRDDDDARIQGALMEPKYVNREGEYAIGLAGSFPANSHGAIHQLWNRFHERQKEIKHVRPGYALGVCMPAHPDVTKAEGDSFVYAAALPVTSTDDIPEGMVVCKLESARYAVFTHKGPLAKLPETIKYIWGTWLPANGQKQKDAPDFELYDNRFHPDTLDGEFDIYVPVV